MRASEGNPSVPTHAGAHMGAWRPFALVGLAVVLTQFAFSLTLAALPLYLRDLSKVSHHLATGYVFRKHSICS